MSEENSLEFSDLLYELSLNSEVLRQAAHLRLRSLGLIRKIEEPMLGAKLGNTGTYSMMNLTARGARSVG